LLYTFEPVSCGSFDKTLVPGTAPGPNEVTAPTATEALVPGTAPGPSKVTPVTKPTATATEAMEESSQEGAKWDGNSSENKRTIQFINADKVVSQPWSEESSGDLIVAPEANNTQESEATMADDGDLVMRDTASGKQSQRLNARSAKLILLSDTESSSMLANTVVAAVASTKPKAASEATLYQLGRIPKLQRLPPVAEVEKDDQSSQESAASISGSNPKEDLITIQPKSYARGPSTSCRGSVSAASRGARSSVRDRKGSLKRTTSAAAYNTVGATPRNYLIHVYKSRDDLVPFESVEEFNKL
jgi:hypothetical protein